MDDFFPGYAVFRPSNGFSVCKWLDISFSVFLKRPLVSILFSSLTGAYLGFYFTAFLRSMTAVVYSMIILFSLLWRSTKTRELLVVFMSVAGFAVFFSVFVMWKNTLDSPETAYYQGRAQVISANSSDDGYKNIVLRLDNGEKVIYLTDHVFEYGDEVDLRCFLRPIVSKGNPGDFDTQAYYYRQGIVRQADSPSIERVRNGRFSLVDWGFRFGSKVRKIFYRIWLGATGEETAALLSALIVGDDSKLSSDVKNSFKKSNLSHILVVSGAHVGYFSATVGTITSVFFKNRKKMILLPIFLVLFGFVTGWGGSAARSIFSYLVAGFLAIDEKMVDRLSVCALSALIIMCIDPFAVFSLGILLSFGATFSIMLFQNRTKIKVKRVFGFLPDELCTAISCFVCAQMGMLPVLFLLGGTISLNSMMVVLLAGFPAEVICSCGLVLTVICCFLPGILHSVLFAPISGIVEVLKKMADFGALDTFGRLKLRQIPVLMLVFVVCLILSVLISSGFKRRIMLVFSLCAVSGLLTHSLIYQDNRSCIYFLNVGQGDCALIVHNDISILIDGGNTGNGETIEKTMDHLNISQIDIAFISHLDTDHCAGIFELWNRNKIDRMFTSFWNESDEMDQLKKSGIKLPENVGILTKGDRVRIDQDLCFDVLWPKAPSDGGNDDSLVLLCELYKTKILFTGDISIEAEEKMDKSLICDIDVLKVAHHGSRFSTSDLFLDDIKTDAAIISVGYNHYGHPSREVLSRLVSHQVDYFRTDENGCVELNVSDDAWKLDYYF